MGALEKLLHFLSELDRQHIFYTLSRPRNQAVMVHIAVPGERWEAEFFPGGQVEVEVFRSLGHLDSETALADLFERFGDL